MRGLIWGTNSPKLEVHHNWRGPTEVLQTLSSVADLQGRLATEGKELRGLATQHPMRHTQTEIGSVGGSRRWAKQGEERKEAGRNPTAKRGLRPGQAATT